MGSSGKYGPPNPENNVVAGKAVGMICALFLAEDPEVAHIHNDMTFFFCRRSCLSVRWG